jgi:acyl carrier protein
MPATASKHGKEGGMTVERDELAQTVADVWADVLRVAQVREDDGFYELGGHSLAALRAIHILRDRLSVHLSLRDLMAARTLADFTRTVRDVVSGAAPARPIAVLAGRRGTR